MVRAAISSRYNCHPPRQKPSLSLALKFYQHRAISLVLQRPKRIDSESVVFESEQEHHTYSMAKKSADYLTIAELCESDWWSRMKANSGSFWMEKDPWWRGNTPRLTRYCRDGTYHTYFFQDHPLTTRLDGFGRFKTKGA